MRNRRTRKQNRPSQNLDSFLDILTNTVGVLMFIGLFVSLLAVEAGTVIRTPLRSETNKIPNFFEVRNNQVFYVSDPNIEGEINEVIATLPRCNNPNIPNNIPDYLYSFYLKQIQEYQACVNSRDRKLKNFYYSNENYQVTISDYGSIIYKPIPSSVGENSKELMNQTSNYISILKQLDPQVNYIAFLVRPDSFEAFRMARQKARSLGYEVGWIPFGEDRVISFGSGGRSVGVQ